MLLLLHLSRIEGSVLSRLLHLRHRWGLNRHGCSLLLWRLGSILLDRLLTRLRSQHFGLFRLRNRLSILFSRFIVAKIRMHAVIEAILRSNLQSGLFLGLRSSLLVVGLLRLGLHLGMGTAVFLQVGVLLLPIVSHLLLLALLTVSLCHHLRSLWLNLDPQLFDLERLFSRLELLQ